VIAGILSKPHPFEDGACCFGLAYPSWICKQELTCRYRSPLDECLGDLALIHGGQESELFARQNAHPDQGRLLPGSAGTQGPPDRSSSRVQVPWLPYSE